MLETDTNDGRWIFYGHFIVRTLSREIKTLKSQLIPPEIESKSVLSKTELELDVNNGSDLRRFS